METSHVAATAAFVLLSLGALSGRVTCPWTWIGGTTVAVAVACLAADAYRLLVLFPQHPHLKPCFAFGIESPAHALANSCLYLLIGAIACSRSRRAATPPPGSRPGAR